MAEYLDSQAQASGPSPTRASSNPGGAITKVSNTGGNQPDVVIISAYSRGNWLASELASRGWKVTLVDVTESLGAWEPEDAEGPFGLLEASDLFPSQKTHLLEEGGIVGINSGFTLWLKNGPIECRSELSAYQLDGHRIPKAVESYLRLPGLPDKEAARMRDSLAKLPFSETWLAHFAHQLPSTLYAENHRALKATEMPLPIFAPFAIRQASTVAATRGLKACQASGVKIRQKACVKDIRLSGRAIDVIEIQDDQAGIERGKTYVWLLSSAETEQSSKNVAKILFPDGALLPEWFWCRYRVDFDQTGSWRDDQFPAHAVIVEDPLLPWTHTNVIVLRKRAQKGTYDAWVRLPGRARGDRPYLEKIGQEIEGCLKGRMPLFRPKVVGLPAEARVPLDQLGPAPVPVFSKAEMRSFHPLRLTNLFYCGPEYWTFLDWTGQYRAQNQLLAKLEKLRAIWIAEALKAEQRAAAREAAQRSDQRRPS